MSTPLGFRLGFGNGKGEGVLDHAAIEARRCGFDRFPIVDADAHHYEERSLRDIIPFIKNPTIQRRALTSWRSGSHGNVMPNAYGDQRVAGRILRPGANITPDESAPRRPGEPDFVSEFRHATQRMGIDYAVMFPTTILHIGKHPDPEVESQICHAYAEWMTSCVLPCDPALLTMLPLPFNDEVASLALIEEFAEKPGVVGFMVTSVREQPVHHRKYMKIYSTLEERGLPLGFHAVSSWEHASQIHFNRFLSVHALGFPMYNMIHLINTVVNGLPERFPRLRFIWIESGVAWIPFLMQRLDNEYLMRTSEAPLLARKPSEYMRDFFYTTQPLEGGDTRFLEAVFDFIDGENQLLFASDYPHWDFDLPTRIYDLPFLSESAKRKILGGNALRLFGLPTPPQYLAEPKTPQGRSVSV